MSLNQSKPQPSKYLDISDESRAAYLADIAKYEKRERMKWAAAAYITLAGSWGLLIFWLLWTIAGAVKHHLQG